MGLVEPGIGLIIWMTIAFLVVWVGLYKMAWPSILQSIKEREDSIQKALNSSSEAKAEVENLKSEIDEMRKEARVERETIITEARESANKIVAESKDSAKAEYDRIVKSAQEDIRNEKNAALAEVKSQVAKFSIEIAEKVLTKELADKKAQENLVEDLLKNI
ncbi:MAG: F0F1 ATP synthase subunit B [Flammeovirgaceae bacterium]|nr:F0F1 ATP synthase subunit B [Flammeovirgaceae bacterium]